MLCVLWLKRFMSFGIFSNEEINKAILWISPEDTPLASIQAFLLYYRNTVIIPMPLDMTEKQKKSNKFNNSLDHVDV